MSAHEHDGDHLTTTTTTSATVVEEEVDAAGTPEPLATVRAFVNTLDVEAAVDEFATADGIGAWLVRSRLFPGSAEPVLDEHDKARVVAVRSALRELLVANHDGDRPPPGALAVLSQESERCPLRVRWEADGDAQLVPAANLAPVDTVIGRLLVIVHDAIREGRWSRLRLCREDTCQWAFYDASRNRSGKWCGSGCANRANVRAYRERQRRGR